MTIAVDLDQFGYLALIRTAPSRYGLAKELPGGPDLVFRKWRKVTLMLWCFGHRHADCKPAFLQKSRLDFWLPGARAKESTLDKIREDDTW